MRKPLPGVAYYPEHWPEEWWSTDARMMRDAGLSVVRIAGRDRHSQSHSTRMAHLQSALTSWQEKGGKTGNITN
jgi:hypothetical protein